MQAEQLRSVLLQLQGSGNEAAWYRLALGVERTELDAENERLFALLIEHRPPKRVDRLEPSLAMYWLSLSLEALLSGATQRGVAAAAEALFDRFGFSDVDAYLEHGVPEGRSLVTLAAEYAERCLDLASGGIAVPLHFHFPDWVARLHVRDSLGCRGRCLCRLRTGELILLMDRRTRTAPEMWQVLLHEAGHHVYWEHCARSGWLSRPDQWYEHRRRSESLAFQFEHQLILRSDLRAATSVPETDILRAQTTVAQRIASRFLGLYTCLGGRRVGALAKALHCPIPSGTTPRKGATTRDLDAFVLKASALLLPPPGEWIQGLEST